MKTAQPSLWYLVVLKVSQQHEWRNPLNSPLLCLRVRLKIAGSYNLWSSADHRCWLVGWGAFLIKRQMSGDGMLTFWHYKDWHYFNALCLLCRPMYPREGMNTAALLTAPCWQVGLSPPSSQLFCSYICAAKMEVNSGCFGSGKGSTTRASLVCLLKIEEQLFLLQP